jgi:hypothetical protein
MSTTSLTLEAIQSPRLFISEMLRQKDSGVKLTRSPDIFRVLGPRVSFPGVLGNAVGDGPYQRRHPGRIQRLFETEIPRIRLCHIPRRRQPPNAGPEQPCNLSLNPQM